MIALLTMLTTLGTTALAPPATVEIGPSDTVRVDLTEWTVPYEDSRPRDPYVALDGKVWFVGQKSDYVASFDPQTGVFKKFDLERGTGPHTVIVGDDGTVWIAGNQKGYIGKMDPASGNVEKIAMPDPHATDPHTMAFTSDDNIWFTLQVSNRIGFLNTKTNAVKLVRLETGQARPYGLKVDANDHAWVALLGTNKLATADPATMTVEEIELPRKEAHPRRLVLASDGGVWYVDYAEGYLGRYDPSSKSFKEWPMPEGSNSQPYGMAIDASDRIWFVETGPQPNHFVGFDPATESFFSNTTIKSGAGAVRNMFYDSRTGQVWFGTDANTLGRARVSADMPQ